jgi:hypothetical protein
MRVTFSVINSNPNTIWNKLAVRLGRAPTHAEAVAEVKRIMSEVTVDLAGAGRLPHQRRRLSCPI